MTTKEGPIPMSPRFPIATTLLAALALIGAPASADSFEDLLARLDADELIVRENATDELRRLMGADTDPQAIESAHALERESAEALRTRDLSLEQKLRLLDAMRDRFFRTPRGAMGVQFVQMQPRPMGVELERVVEGFPAGDQGILKRGDVITSVAGISLVGAEFAQLRGNGLSAAAERLRYIVISHDPGDTVEMTVLRPHAVAGERPLNPAQAAAVPGGGDLITEGPGKNADVLTVRVPLGSFERLQQGAMLDPRLLNSAWKERVDRLGVPEVSVRSLSSQVSMREWTTHRKIAKQDPPRRLGIAADFAGAAEFLNAAYAQSNSPPEVEVRQPPIPVQDRARRAVQVNAAKARDAAIRKALEQQAPAAVPADAETARKRVEGLRMVIEGLGKQRDEALARATDATLTEEERTSARTGAARLQSAIDVFKVELQRHLESLPEETPKEP